MTDKITPIPTKPDALKAAGERLQREMTTLAANAKVIARLKKAQYDAYIDVGFTPQQALELIKHS